VPEVIAFHWAAGARRHRETPGFAATFLPGGEPPAKGDVFRNPALASSLAQVADGGRDAFYGGAIAERIGAFCRRVGAPLRAEDLAAHASRWVDAVSTTWRDLEVFELPPSGQGIAVLQMLNLLDACDVASLAWGSAAYLHLLVEAKKIAYEDRARLYADPTFADVPVERLISKAHARERARLFDPDRAASNVAPSPPSLAEGDTVCLAVADPDRMMVSLMQSNYRGFGSGFCPDGLGFGLQDRGALFALDEGHPNVLAPGKRPFHTIIPGFATRGGEPFLCFGVMGGDMQPQGQVQVLLDVTLFGMDFQEAGDAPRLYHAGSSTPTGRTMTDGGGVALERGFPPEAREGLVRRGHRLVEAPGRFGGYQAVAYDAARDLYVGASESRKDGHAAGF